MDPAFVPLSAGRLDARSDLDELTTVTPVASERFTRPNALFLPLLGFAAVDDSKATYFPIRVTSHARVGTVAAENANRKTLDH
ncbi:MAG: hypothetical protein Q8N51_00845 [Gammaproteobacteria bacterium]|nr:hypothetical protein [Gammaproteobacteria bacterium]